MVKTRPRDVAREKIKNIVIPDQEKEKFGRASSSTVNQIKCNPVFAKGSLIQIQHHPMIIHAQRQSKLVPGKIIAVYKHHFLVKTKLYPVSISWIDIYVGDVGIIPMTSREMYRELGYIL